ncbi:NAD(P)-dependent oxidoreductase [Aquibacillus koreensis]|uniref:NAD(P)-dependent oxidoreductase n=1 Tax=Aquibacillus koreensis TaxID=279446 RepID=A0A9X3WL75_9BACI|nr:NAD(P)-dependent oxidoreductase [Aquibacillus koreensis]MCT2538173.1 NAD(P)-dependent oxidoreductase [Aquibacillus koreensis]MDC3420883.1 NAD(P)-dependent oxidoreductase [Aquibacillus koreensis]
MKKVVITGGSGLLGPSVIKEFLDNGYEVLNVDQQLPKEKLCETIIADLTSLGEVYDVLSDADAVVHLAAVPRPFIYSNDVTFRNNVMSTYNILEAASNLGIKKAVITSSESCYGIVFAKNPIKPQYVPLDEDHPRLPQDSYGLSKIVNEENAEMIHNRTGMQVVSLRIGNVITPETYKDFPSFIHDPEVRKTIVWSYIDARDAAKAYRLAVEKDGLGAVALNVAADNSSMDMKSSELMASVYPDVEIRGELTGYETLYSNKKAKELLDWQPVHNWRDYVKVD